MAGTEWFQLSDPVTNSPLRGTVHGDDYSRMEQAHRGRELSTEPIQVFAGMGRDPRDFIWVSLVPLIHQRVVDALTAAGCTGWSIYPVTMHGRKGSCCPATTAWSSPAAALPSRSIATPPSWCTGAPPTVGVPSTKASSSTRPPGMAVTSSVPRTARADGEWSLPACEICSANLASLTCHSRPSMKSRSTPKASRSSASPAPVRYPHPQAPAGSNSPSHPTSPPNSSRPPTPSPSRTSTARSSPSAPSPATNSSITPNVSA
jgi:hypothetical protein